MPNVCVGQHAAERARITQVEGALKAWRVSSTIPNHARSIALVLNPRTGHVSPQFHVKFDDFFKTVHAKATDLDAPDSEW